jgi:SOS response regulatory protein OraA/RecX
VPRYSGTERIEARRARLERHAAETDAGVVLKAAARYLELRSRSVDEVRRHLNAAKFPDSLVEHAVARLVELGLLDDLAFSRAWVESRDRARPRGSQALRRELNLKGIDRDTIEALLAGRRDAAGNRDTDPADASLTGSRGFGGAGFGEQDPEVEPGSADERAAQRLLHKNRASLGRVADPRLRRQRAYALLARNGFDPEICRDASARVVEAEGDTDSGASEI